MINFLKNVLAAKLSRSLPLTLSIFLTGAPSWGNDFSTVEVFRGKSTVIVDQLISKGYGELRSVNLLDLKNQAPEVIWRAYDGEVQPKDIFDRGSAYYRKDSKTVTILSDVVDFSENAVDVLALHEMLGALGVKDENYQTSLGLYLLADPELANPGSFLIKEGLENAMEFLGGTGTSVSGGGDMTALTLKLKAWERLKSADVKISGFLAFASQSVEPDHVDMNSEVRIDISTRSHRDFEIVVPARAWASGTPSLREKILSKTVILLNILNGINSEYTWAGRLVCPERPWPKDIYLSRIRPKESLKVLKKALKVEGCEISKRQVTPADLLKEFLEQRQTK